MRCGGTVFLVALLLLGGCDKIEERNWMVMGTTAAVKVKNAPESVDSAANVTREVFTGLETLLNAHNPDSELSRLAMLDNSEICRRCDRSVSRCYGTAFRLSEQSSGAFNPRWKGPKTMDLGAIAKGYAVDEACRRLRREVKDVNLLVDLGGNLKALNGEWRVGILGGETITLTNEMACATSGEYFRGKHIYDARTGNPVSNNVVSVTIVHPSSAMLADGLSTICFIFGKDKGEEFLKTHYPEARAIWILR